MPMIPGEWIKHTNPSGNCVEVKLGTIGEEKDLILVRDSKRGGFSPTLTFTLSEWRSFLEGVKIGEFDVA